MVKYLNLKTISRRCSAAKFGSGKREIAPEKNVDKNGKTFASKR